MFAQFLCLDFFPALFYLINLLSDQPNKKYLPMINNFCFLTIVVTFLLMAQGANAAIYCAGSMVFLATMFFMGYLKQMLIKFEDKQKKL